MEVKGIKKGVEVPIPDSPMEIQGFKEKVLYDPTRPDIFACLALFITKLDSLVVDKWTKGIAKEEINLALILKVIPDKPLPSLPEPLGCALVGNKILALFDIGKEHPLVLNAQAYLFLDGLGYRMKHQGNLGAPVILEIDEEYVGAIMPVVVVSPTIEEIKRKDEVPPEPELGGFKGSRTYPEEEKKKPTKSKKVVKKKAKKPAKAKNKAKKGKRSKVSEADLKLLGKFLDKEDMEKIREELEKF